MHSNYGGGGYGGGPPGQRPISKNIEEIERQSELNRLKRLQEEQNQKLQDQKKVHDREAGFNVYLSGANEKRIAEQRQREKYGNVFQGAGSSGSGARASSKNRSGSRSGRHGARNDSQGARRRWLAPPSDGTENDLQSSSQYSDAKKSNYQNPFSINESTNQSPFTGPNIPRPGNQPSGRRKQWGLNEPQSKQDVIGTNFLDSNTPDTIARKNQQSIKKFSLSDSEDEEEKKTVKQSQPPLAQFQPAQQQYFTNKNQIEDEDEDDYSDSFEEINNTVETVHHAHEIEDLLKTATEDQLNILKESLGNWADVKRLADKEAGSAQNSAQKMSAQKGANNQVLDQQKNTIAAEDEDYIEEDFEEDNSDSPIEDATGDNQDSDGEEERLEQERLEQMRKASNSHNRIQSTRIANKPSRPISATYSLTPHLNRPTGQNNNNGSSSSTNLNSGYKAGAFSSQGGATAKKSDTFQEKKAVLSALEEENRRAIQSKRPAASARNYQGPGFVSSMPPSSSSGHLESISGNAAKQQGKMPPKNPFTSGRPISQMLPKRPTEQQKSKTMNQPSLPKVTDHQNYMLGNDLPHQQRQAHARGQNNTIDESNNETMEHDNTFSRQELEGSHMKESSIRRVANKETVTISELLGQIQKLEDSQRHQLFLVLKDMETTGDMSASNLQKGLKQFLVDNPEKPAAPNSKAALMMQELEQPKERNHNELVLRIMSTLGNPHVCGITEIELFDEFSEKIPLVASCIMVRNQGKGPKSSVDKLINGQKLTKDDKQMWLGYLPTPPNRLEILIRFDKNTTIGGLKVWNYNKGILDCTKGVYGLEILLNDIVKWTGQLSPGKGQINVDYAKAIVLLSDAEQQDGFELPKETIVVEQVQPAATIQAPKSIHNLHQQSNSLTSAQSMKQLGSQEDNALDDAKTTEERLRQYRSKLELAQGISNKEPQVALGGISGPIWLDQDPKPKARESKRHSEFRDHQLNPAGNKAQNQRQRGDDFDFGEINSIVQGAVDSVNKAVQMSNTKRKEVRRPALVDESLDSLDFFKVTNLGRFNNTKENASSTKQQSRNQNIIDQTKQAGPQQRPKWGGANKNPQKQTVSTIEHENFQQSITKESSSSRKTNKGPVINSKAMPEEFMMPSPARSIPSRKSKKERDLLDDFMGVQVQNPKVAAPSSFQQQQPQQQPQVKTINTNKVPSYGNQAEPINYQQLYQKPEEPLLDTAQVKMSSARIVPEVFDDMDDSTDETVTAIPTMPQGKKLEINILETWGDMNYLGLTGIEIFDELGMPLEVTDSQILAFPPDVNVLPGYGTDPRTIEKLVDGQNFTNDDLHVWLTPFTSGEDHQISINLGKFVGISMIRIWNYNKSRIHSYRGAKLVQIELDGQVIFRGEIKKAPGNVKNPEDCCEIILFSEDDAVLEMIDENDWLNDLDVQADEFDNTQRITEFQIQEGQLEERPMTATKKFSTTELDELQFQLQQQRSKPTSLFDERPMTSAIVGQQSARIGQPMETQLASVQEEENYYQSSHRTINMQQQQTKKPTTGVRGQVVFINITQSWGDLFYVGLNGLEVLDERGLPIPITIEKNQQHSETGMRTKTSVQAEPRDMNSIPGHGSDHRTLEKLFNGKNNTVDDRNMWLIPFNAGEDHTIRIDLGEPRTLSAVKFYNYNKSIEDTLRGARQVIIKVDEQFMTPKKGISLRVAPGTISGIEDISQSIKLPFLLGWTNEQIIPVQRSLDTQANPVQFFQESEPIAMPMGFLFKFNLYSTHGDLFYIGLNGIEIYDQTGQDVCQTRADQCRIYAHPAGVHSLKGMSDDIRVVSNLTDGQNQTQNDSHIWLTPYKNTKGHANASASNDKDIAKKREPNFIVLMFEQPVAISALRIWNYSKTPSRGVNEYELEIDGQKIYRGFLRQASDDPSNLTSNKDTSSVVLFQGEAKNADSLGRQINFNPRKVQNVLLMNERKQMNAQNQKAHVNEKFVFDEQLRPQTKAFNFK